MDTGRRDRELPGTARLLPLSPRTYGDGGEPVHGEYRISGGKPVVVDVTVEDEALRHARGEAA
ncbi:hypothetical protein [Streptomyces fumanus]|uniref:Uncharacterized protein n=1 Tax=Streptomyces fumanus TaxID=67302 RepID=A0A919ACA2_9ACTN|nr:hypothetical protein [Streptomyces fumanus]GHE98605.1 hypothetical protein GCM10018772_23800 [Streptomyces fumanus]